MSRLLGCLLFWQEVDRRNPIGARCVGRLGWPIDEIRRDLRSARSETPHVVADKRKFDEARVAADLFRDVSAKGWPRHRVELAGEHQGRHAGAGWDERWTAEF